MSIYDHKFIILGSDHSNTLGQIRCLGEKGICPIVIITEKKPYIINKSKYLGEYHIVNTIYDGPKFLIEHYSNEILPPFIYTDRDDIMCAIDDYYDELKGKFIFWNAGEKGNMRKLINKDYQIQLAKECGLTTIPSEVVKRGEMPKSLHFPIFTKANNSLNPFWKANAFVCNDGNELKKAYLHMGIEDVLLQKYVHRKDEMPIEGISINGGQDVKLLVNKNSLRFSNNGFGIYSFLRKFDNNDIEEKVTRLIRKTKYTGIFEIEFIIDGDGTTYFLEINFRTTMFNHACADYGINIIYMFAKSICDNKIDTSNIKTSTNKHLVMYELDDLKHSVLEGNLPIYRWLRDFFTANSYLYIDKKDMMPFYSLIWHKIVKKIKERL